MHRRFTSHRSPGNIRVQRYLGYHNSHTHWIHDYKVDSLGWNNKIQGMDTSSLCVAVLLGLVGLCGRAVSAAPAININQGTCNPGTAENGCDCVEEWFEPTMYLCNPCTNVCKHGADRSRCLQDCPVFAKHFFGSSTTPLTTTTTPESMFTSPDLTTEPPPSPSASEDNSEAYLILVVVLAIVFLIVTLATAYVCWKVRQGRRGGWRWSDVCKRATTPIQETGEADRRYNDVQEEGTDALEESGNSSMAPLNPDSQGRE